MGSSTHNECIERLWRDMYRCVAQHYYDLFYVLEARGKLNPLNQTDLYCLHFVPRIEKHLQMFQESWNHHSLSTENNLSPYQIYIFGFICVYTNAGSCIQCTICRSTYFLLHDSTCYSTEKQVFAMYDTSI